MGAARRLHLELQRIYDEPATAGGYRVLIDRLWPWGISRDRAALDEWAKGRRALARAPRVVRPRAGEVRRVRPPLPR